MPPGATTMSHDISQSRFGVHYVSGICSQAGFGIDEFSIDEDVLAVDATVQFPAVGARVQIKTTRTRALSDASEYISYTAKPGWLDKWRASIVAPVYFVVVLMPPDASGWMQHAVDGTTLSGIGAFWCRIHVEECEKSGQIIVPRANRLDASAIAQWEQATLGPYTGGEGA